MNPLNLIIKPASVYRFAELLQMPYNQYDAYSSKIINEKGKIINEQGSMDGLEYIAIRLRSMFKELMPGSTQYFLGSLAGTLKLFNEEFAQMGLSISDVNVVIEKHLLSESKGKISYLDYLIEEATQRYITEEMTSGVVGNVGTAATPDKQGGIAGLDLPLVGKKKKKRLKDIMIEANVAMTEPKQEQKVVGLFVDPIQKDELSRAVTPNGTFDWSQLSDSKSKNYWKKFIERTPEETIVYVADESQNPPHRIMLPGKKTKRRSV